MKRSKYGENWRPVTIIRRDTQGKKRLPYFSQNNVLCQDSGKYYNHKKIRLRDFDTVIRFEVS